MKTLLSLLLLCASTVLLNAQSTITGKITDEKGVPLQGASIRLKGTKTSTASDVNGFYSIQVPDEQATLVFAYVGFDVQEIKVKGKAVINVKLKASTKSLDEVVVVGHGTQRKRDITGSVAMVSASGIRSNSQGYLSGPPRNEGYNREGYDNIKENEFQKVTDHPLSTFSIDVDAASYSNVRRLINEGRLPTPGAVRIEEMINYFSYNYPQPSNDRPFSITTESAPCPWNEDHQLVMIGMQGRKIDFAKLPPSNLVFLIDVSGSMQDENKLPLVKSSLNLLAEQLRPQDKIAIVVYAGSAGLVLPSTNDKYKIREAINV
jgi:Ca-activated chloride channel family protein